MSKKESFLNRIKKNEVIVIYGAGYYADILYKAIFYTRPDIVVKAFVVSNSDSQHSELLNKPIISYREISRCGDYNMIVVAMNEKNRKEVILNIAEQTQKPFVFLEKEDLQVLRAEFDAAVNSQKVDYQTIVFDCFHGAGYRDNVKYIAEEIRKRNKGITLYWYVEDADDTFPEYIIPFKYSEIGYYKILFSAGVIISNNAMNFQDYRKKKGQYLINTWHGIDGIKKVGIDNNFDKNNQNVKQFYVDEFGKNDLMIAGNRFNHYLYRHSLGFKDEIADWGYARNDILVKNDECLKKVIRDRLEIQDDELMVLYAPTYRHELENTKSVEEVREVFDIDFHEVRKAFKSKYGRNVKLLYRLHHVLYRNPIIKDLFSEITNVTSYPDMQELLLAADVLITDYSSCMWDYSLTYKPVFLYLKDIDMYEQYPGFYHSPLDYPFPHGMNTRELCNAIIGFDEQKYTNELIEYHKKMDRYDDGHASEKAADRILDVISHPESYTK